MSKEEKIVDEEKDDIFQELNTNKNKALKEHFLPHLWRKTVNKDFSIFKNGIGGIIDEYRDFLDKKDETIEKYMAYETVIEGATGNFDYYILLILSGLIATIGLYQNSPAVIIGAMIVAPLMGPIFGFSASILWGNGQVILRAVITLLAGSILIVIITAILTYIIPGITVTAEMMARSKPTLFDIIVALSSGAIGAYAYVNNKVSAAIPGVAISVALMPPISTAGIGIGLMNWELAKGASLLFLINLLGISLASLLVFYLARLHPKSKDEKEFARAKVRTFGNMAVLTLLLLIISVPLVYFMATTIRDSREESLIYEKIAEFFPENKIYSIDITKDIILDATNNVEVVMLQSRDYSDSDLKSLENDLYNSIGKVVKVKIFFINEYNQVKTVISNTIYSTNTAF